jgi:hypothetical protein
MDDRTVKSLLIGMKSLSIRVKSLGDPPTDAPPPVIHGGMAFVSDVRRCVSSHRHSLLGYRQAVLHREKHGK